MTNVSKDSGDQGELYDLAAAPYQLNNVYGQPVCEAVRLDLLARVGRNMDELEDPLGAGSTGLGR